MLMDSAAGAFDDSSRFGDQGAAIRVPFVHGCLLTTRSRGRGGLVCNLSVLGVYVTLDEPLPERGERVRLAVQLPGQPPLLEADTVVTWQNREPATNPDSLPVGVGLRFVSMAALYRQRVAELVRERQIVLPHAGPNRVPYVQRCSFSAGGGTTETLICNLSRLGAYVTIDPIPEVGVQVVLAFKPPADRREIALQGLVAWRNPHEREGLDPLAPGCGIRFVSLSKEDDRRLRALLEPQS